MNATHAGGSILASSDPQTLQPLVAPLGTFTVRYVADLDEHVLFLKRNGYEINIVSHANGFACRRLAERIVAVWAGDADESTAVEQFGYILDCGGMGISHARILDILAI